MSELTRTTRKLVAAYDRLLASHRVSNAAEFKLYCDTYEVDHDAVMEIAREDVSRYLGEMRRR